MYLFCFDQQNARARVYVHGDITKQNRYIYECMQQQNKRTLNTYYEDENMYTYVHERSPGNAEEVRNNPQSDIYVRIYDRSNIHIWMHDRDTNVQQARLHTYAILPVVSV
jgi:hypothetical protein